MPRVLTQVPTTMDDIPPTIVGNVSTEPIPKKQREEACRSTAPIVTTELDPEAADARKARFFEALVRTLIQQRRARELQKQRKIREIQESVNKRLEEIRRKH